MKAPKKVRMIYNNHRYDGDKGKDYFEIIRVKNGAPVFEIWASMWVGGKRTGERQYKLAWRETLTKAWVNSDVSMSVMNGYTVRFIEGWYGIQDTMVKTTGSRPNFKHGWTTCYTVLWDEKDIRKCKDFKYIKDDVLENIRLQNGFDVMKLLRVWKEYPKAEYLINNRLAYMTQDKRFLKIKDKKWDKWIYQNRFELAKNQPTYNYCRRAFKNEFEYQEQYIYDQLNKKDVDITHYLYKQTKEYKEQVNYINASSLYNDYINALEILNVNENLTPANIYEAHEKWTKKLKRNRTKALNTKLNKISTGIEKALKKEITKDGLIIKLCHSRKDFETLGAKLHNCVARMEYDIAMAKGQCLIFGIWKDEKPIECVEILLKGKPSINQCYGNHNRASEYHETCMDICNQFIRTKAVRQLSI